MSPPIRSAIRAAQKEAFARGANTFAVEQPCIHGHNAPRKTSNGLCTECVATYRKRVPKEDRMVRQARNSTRPVQFYQDSATASLSATSRKRFAEIIGRPMSGNMIHKAAVALLARYLSGPVTVSDVRALLR